MNTNTTFLGIHVMNTTMLGIHDIFMVFEYRAMAGGGGGPTAYWLGTNG